MLNEERKKLATMGNAATREANTPVGGGRRRSSTVLPPPPPPGARARARARPITT